MVSVVLATDELATVAPVLERLRAQTIRERVEVVLVAPSLEAVAGAAAELGGVGVLRVVAAPGLPSLAEARAEGVRAASAPLVFVGETHSYPHQDMLELLAAAHDADGGWAVVVPGFGSANPGGALSRAGFVADYGSWAAGLERREVTYAPIYNASYRRDVLVGLGDGLTRAFAHGDAMAIAMRAGDHRTLFEPAARIDHLNVATPGAYLRERFCSGLVIAGERSRRWPWWRRLAYALGSPLLPAVYLARARPGLRSGAQDGRLPRGTLPALVLGAAVKAAGEAAGYIAGWRPRGGERLTEYELHKVRYAGAPRR